MPQRSSSSARSPKRLLRGEARSRVSTGCEGSGRRQQAELQRCGFPDLVAPIRHAKYEHVPAAQTRATQDQAQLPTSFEFRVRAFAVALTGICEEFPARLI